MRAEHIYIPDDAFPWTRQGNSHFRGYLFDLQGRFLRGKEALRLFEGIRHSKDMGKKLRELDGAFTLCTSVDEGELIGVDAMSMFSLYYTWHEGRWLISDSARALAVRMPRTDFNHKALPEFLGAGFVLGRELLLQGIYKTRAGEVLLLKDKGEAESHCSHHYLPTGFSTMSREALSNELKDVLDGLSQRLVSSLEGRTAVVPLSGGYDSRLIATLLKRAGYEKVICITYGRPNRESQLSEKVARQLDYPWHFIDYRKVDSSSLLKDPLFLSYADYAGNAGSMPFLQEYFACKVLKEEGLIPGDSIFLPGHTGDYIAGSYVEKSIRKAKNEQDRCKRLIKKYFSFIKPSGREKKQVEERLKAWFSQQDYPAHITHPHYDVLTEDWDLKEKFSKFVFNSARVFSFFGFQYRLPLWDKAFRDFFRILPFEYRSYKQLYDHLLESEYFSPMDLYFGKEEIREGPAALRAQDFRSFFRPLIPKGLRKKRMIERDYICYHAFTREMAKELVAQGESIPKSPGHLNAIICQWYAMHVKQGANKQ